MNPVFWLQLISGFAWAIPMYLRARPTWDHFRGTGTKKDAVRSIGFLFAALQIYFICRWMVWPAQVAAMSDSQMIAWGTGYAASSVIAIHYSLLILRGRI